MIVSLPIRYCNFKLKACIEHWLTTQSQWSAFESTESSKQWEVALASWVDTDIFAGNNKWHPSQPRVYSLPLSGSDR